MVGLQEPRQWSIGERVKYLRVRWGWTQREIQARGGPSRVTLVGLERNQADTDVTYRSTLANLASVLGCRVEWLLTGEGEIWAKGVNAPEEMATGTVIPRVLARSMPPRRSDCPITVGRWVTTGPIDWAIVSRSVQLLDTAMTSDARRVRKACTPFSIPHALQLIYTYLSQQPDPLGRVQLADVATILSIASR